jgi:hypothetical protein
MPRYTLWSLSVKWSECSGERGFSQRAEDCKAAVCREFCSMLMCASDETCIRRRAEGKKRRSHRFEMSREFSCVLNETASGLVAMLTRTITTGGTYWTVYLDTLSRVDVELSDRRFRGSVSVIREWFIRVRYFSYCLFLPLLGVNDSVRRFRRCPCLPSPEVGVSIRRFRDLLPPSSGINVSVRRFRDSLFSIVRDWC